MRPKPGSTANLASLFPDINRELAEYLLKDIPQYDPFNEDERLSDWCAWCSSLRLQSFTSNYANYIILARAGRVCAREFIRRYQFDAENASTECFIRSLGAEVYRELKRDPVQIATQLQKGRFGCDTLEKVFRRVVDLHFCCYTATSIIVFVRDLLYGVAFPLKIDLGSTAEFA